MFSFFFLVFLSDLDIELDNNMESDGQFVEGMDVEDLCCCGMCCFIV